MTDYEFEEEEFDSQINISTLSRIFSLVKAYRLWIIGFLVLICLTSVFDSYFTYLSKRFIDEGIIPRNFDTIKNLALLYILMVVLQAVFVFGFIYLVCWVNESGSIYGRVCLTIYRIYPSPTTT